MQGAVMHAGSGLSRCPALAQQSPNDVEMLKKYAGTWAVDCAKPGTPPGGRRQGA